MTKILTVRSLLADNGPGTQSLTLAVHMRDRGYETVFVTGGGANVPNVIKAGFDLHHIPELAPDRHRPLAIARAVTALAKIIGREKPDVIHGHNGAATLCAHVAGLLNGRRIPCVTSVRGVEERASHQWRNAIWKHVPGILLGVCENTRSRLLGFGVPDHRIQVTYNGVNLARFDPTQYDNYAERAKLGLANRVVVGTVGAMVGPETLDGPTKGHHLLIMAANRLRAEFPEIAVLLVGDGPWRQSLEELTATLGMTDHVVFAGRRFDVPAMLSAMDVYALPSIFGEFFPNSIIEAMAMKCPWIGSDIAGLSELTANGEAGWVSPPGDLDALTNNLRKLLADPMLRQRRGEVARAEVEERFAINHVVDRVLQAYERAK